MLTGDLKAEIITIKMTSANQVVTVSLDDNVATQDLLKQLPLSLELTDYHHIEKIAYLPKSLSVEGLPKGYNPNIGDITYYAPWGNLAMFYGDFGYASGLIKLGRVNPETQTLESLTGDTVIIERVQ